MDLAVDHSIAEVERMAVVALVEVRIHRVAALDRLVLACKLMQVCLL